MTTEDERNMNHFNENVRGCKKRRESKPQASYVAGCMSITCDPVDVEGVSPVPRSCRCAMNDGEGGPVSGFIATWQGRYGVK